MSPENFERFRKELMSQVVEQTVRKRFKPQISQYVLGIISGTILVARGRTLIRLPPLAKSTMDFVFPSIIVGPTLGAAAVFKARGGEFNVLRRDVTMARETIMEARDTLKFTQDALKQAAWIRSRVNLTALASAAISIATFFTGQHSTNTASTKDTQTPKSAETSA